MCVVLRSRNVCRSILNVRFRLQASVGGTLDVRNTSRRLMTPSDMREANVLPTAFSFLYSGLQSKVR